MPKLSPGANETKPISLFLNHYATFNFIHFNSQLILCIKRFTISLSDGRCGNFFLKIFWVSLNFLNSFMSFHEFLLIFQNFRKFFFDSQNLIKNISIFPHLPDENLKNYNKNRFDLWFSRISLRIVFASKYQSIGPRSEKLVYGLESRLPAQKNELGKIIKMSNWWITWLCVFLICWGCKVQFTWCGHKCLCKSIKIPGKLPTASICVLLSQYGFNQNSSVSTPWRSTIFTRQQHLALHSAQFNWKLIDFRLINFFHINNITF